VVYQICNQLKKNSTGRFEALADVKRVYRIQLLANFNPKLIHFATNTNLLYVTLSTVTVLLQ
jgi:hypothetical protein